ncbi:MAG: histidine--tRNA ligase, partial [Clostridia bacterium]|nr:histidine--tRNA ligase [Clostridia bacterium]
MKNIQKIRGTVDILPEQTSLWQYIEGKIRSKAALYGFEEIRFPTFEQTELFNRGVGGTTDIVQKEMYTFSDRDGTSLSLRPEGTACVVRSLVENGLYARAMPQKLYYLTNFFRHERPQAGRTREFFQFGTEIFGADTPLADATVITLADSVFKALGITGIKLKINSIGCRECRKDFQAALKEYYKAHYDVLCDTCKSRLETNPLRILDCKSPVCSSLKEGAPKTLDYLCEGCRTHHADLCSALDASGVDYETDPFIVRGLDYYTKTVFEFVAEEIGAQSTVCGGG